MDYTAGFGDDLLLAAESMMLSKPAPSPPPRKPNARQFIVSNNQIPSSNTSFNIPKVPLKRTNSSSSLNQRRTLNITTKDNSTSTTPTTVPKPPIFNASNNNTNNKFPKPNTIVQIHANRAQNKNTVVSLPKPNKTANPPTLPQSNSTSSVTPQKPYSSKVVIPSRPTRNIEPPKADPETSHNWLYPSMYL